MNRLQRKRMIFDLPPAYQLAIRLRALKSGLSTSEVLCTAIENFIPKDIEEARVILQNNETCAERI